MEQEAGVEADEDTADGRTGVEVEEDTADIPDTYESGDEAAHSSAVPDDRCPSLVDGELSCSATVNDHSFRLCDDCDEAVTDCRCNSSNQHSGSADAERGVELNENKAFQAFRDVQATEKVNSHHNHSSRMRSSDSTCSSASSMNPQLIKEKVRRHFKSQQQRQYARRVRKSGEAALVTRQRREHTDNIKQSTAAEWY